MRRWEWGVGGATRANERGKGTGTGREDRGRKARRETVNEAFLSQSFGYSVSDRDSVGGRGPMAAGGPTSWRPWLDGPPRYCWADFSGFFFSPSKVEVDILEAHLSLLG